MERADELHEPALVGAKLGRAALAVADPLGQSMDRIRPRGPLAFQPGEPALLFVAERGDALGFPRRLRFERGDGFMSLYGHNETLIRETGDWVESGEDIATVGDSGGNPEPALYFEIRRAGKPVDPRRWCAGPLGS